VCFLVGAPLACECSVLWNLNLPVCFVCSHAEVKPCLASCVCTGESKCRFLHDSAPRQLISLPFLQFHTCVRSHVATTCAARDALLLAALHAARLSCICMWTFVCVGAIYSPRAAAIASLACWPCAPVSFQVRICAQTRMLAHPARHFELIASIGSCDAQLECAASLWQVHFACVVFPLARLN
jgi:hypothetical protein